jgi:tryptophan-rich sensory protein
MQIQWKKLIPCLALPLSVGGLSAFFTRSSMTLFETLVKPPLSPPGWLFPIVWTILYLMMGAASYLVLTSGQPSGAAPGAYALQLGLNFFWPILFFNLQQYLSAFLWLILLWIAIRETMVLFGQISKAAGKLMLPYLLWVTFAGYLNLGIWILNT